MALTVITGHVAMGNAAVTTDTRGLNASTVWTTAPTIPVRTERVWTDTKTTAANVWQDLKVHQRKSVSFYFRSR